MSLFWRGLAVIFLVNTWLEAKLLIVTHSYNRPDFIEIQEKTFKKFLKDDYKFVVFNDAPGEEMAQSIASTCRGLGLQHIRIPQSIHSKPYLYRLPGEDKNHSAVRCANVVQYSLDVLGFDHDGIVVIIDSDMFLIDDFSIEDFLKNYDIAGVPQSRGDVHYIWNGLVFFNMNTLPNKRSINFNCGVINGQPLDVGGHTYHYFKQHPEVRLYPINTFHISHATLADFALAKKSVIHLVEKHPHNIEFLLGFTFFHYRGGGNWNGASPQYHKEKTALLNCFIEELLQE
jgi:hypothetical protein